MKPYFHDLFDSVESIRSEFNEPNALPDGAVVIAAAYSYEDYSGYAAVVYVHDGVMYEVYGSHCSCSGLEDQWKPEPVQRDELCARMSRIADGNRAEVDVSLYGISSEFARHVVAALEAAP